MMFWWPPVAKYSTTFCKNQPSVKVDVEYTHTGTQRRHSDFISLPTFVKK
jgi:hypothetical protein